MYETNFKFMIEFFHKRFTKITILFFLLMGLILAPSAILNSWAIHEESIWLSEVPPIPSWIKNNAGWWADDKISEVDFLQAIGYLIDNKIITLAQWKISETAVDTTDNKDYSVPAWIKNNAGWWASGQIPDSAFVSGLKWLIENGIMHISVEKFLSGLPINDVKISPIVIGDKHNYVWFHSGLFEVYVHPQNYVIEEGIKKWLSPVLGLNPHKMEQYNEIALWHDNSQKAAVIFPIFTSTAYDAGGFYDYYRGECEDCTTTTIKPAPLLYTSSGNAVQALTLLGYDLFNDIDIDKNPDILKEYDKIIMLHNEYVTQTIFDAVTSHPKVIYLFPNALYAEIEVDYNDNTITLIRGHDYPLDDPVTNGFDWEFENTHPYEYDNDCFTMELYSILDPRSNGAIHWMANCYPDVIFSIDERVAFPLLKAIKDL